MKRTPALTGALILALTATAIPAFAQERGDGPRGPRGPMLPFEEIDANGDGQITQEEIAAHAAARFAQADTDGDGTLSSEELVARMEAQRAERMQRRAERMIERRDANKDGRLTADEMGPRGGDRLFARLDANEDGVITKEELDQAREAFRERHEGKHKHFGEHRKGQRGGPVVAPGTSE
ncbi:EF-hand domain-containing protein [Pseudooceanicola sp.]|uniref:EF-hand domain-containing protein n=1 Tax=Pseudooceanicola sp. TaxID=1914328 RepID=UPI0035C74FEC